LSSRARRSRKTTPIALLLEAKHICTQDTFTRWAPTTQEIFWVLMDAGAQVAEEDKAALLHSHSEHTLTQQQQQSKNRKRRNRDTPPQDPHGSAGAQIAEGGKTALLHSHSKHSQQSNNNKKTHDKDTHQEIFRILVEAGAEVAEDDWAVLLHFEPARQHLAVAATKTE
jgi:hypothetical protein